MQRFAARPLRIGLCPDPPLRTYAHKTTAMGRGASAQHSPCLTCRRRCRLRPTGTDSSRAKTAPRATGRTIHTVTKIPQGNPSAKCGTGTSFLGKLAGIGHQTKSAGNVYEIIVIRKYSAVNTGIYSGFGTHSTSLSRKRQNRRSQTRIGPRVQHTNAHTSCVCFVRAFHQTLALCA